MNLFISNSMQDDANAAARGYKFLGSGLDKEGNETHIFEAMSLDIAGVENFQCDLVSTESTTIKPQLKPDTHQYVDGDGWLYATDSNLVDMWKFYRGCWYDFANGLTVELKKLNHSSR